MTLRAARLLTAYLGRLQSRSCRTLQHYHLHVCTVATLRSQDVILVRTIPRIAANSVLQGLRQCRFAASAQAAPRRPCPGSPSTVVLPHLTFLGARFPPSSLRCPSKSPKAWRTVIALTPLVLMNPDGHEQQASVHRVPGNGDCLFSALVQGAHHHDHGSSTLLPHMQRHNVELVCFGW